MARRICIDARPALIAGFLVSLSLPGVAVHAEHAGVSIEDERVSLQVDGMPLGELLSALNGSGSVRIRASGDLSGIKVSASLDNLAVRQVLRRLLSDFSYVLIEDAARNPVAVELILLVPPDATAAADPHGPPGPAVQEPEQVPVEDLLFAAQSAPSARERATALEMLVYRSSDDDSAAAYAAAGLAGAVTDPDEQLRAAALETLKDTADEVPVDALVRMAREDPSPDRRFQALELLVERAEEQSHESLRMALTDPAIAERARALIEDWHISVDEP